MIAQLVDNQWFIVSGAKYEAQPSWNYGIYSYTLTLSSTPEETVSVKVFEYIVINVESDPSAIVAGPTCIVAECADEARVAAGQATASLGVPASHLKVLVRQFAG